MQSSDVALKLVAKLPRVRLGSLSAIYVAMTQAATVTTWQAMGRLAVLMGMLVLFPFAAELLYKRFLSARQ